MLKVTAALAGVLLIAGAASAQQPNPIAQALAAEAKGNETNMVSAAEAMPAEKYTFKPTPPQITFADAIYHAAAANHMLCAAMAGDKAPETTVKATGSKPALIDQLKQSFAYCNEAFEKIDPAALGKEVPMMNRKVTLAWLILHTALDWGDHYAQVAMMLRLNGIVPPSSVRK